MMYPKREALRESCRELVAVVIDDATPKQWADWVRIPVEHAAAQGKFNLVTALLKAGGTGASGVRGRGGRTILDAAAKGGNGNVVSAILNAGAKPDLGIRSGKKKRAPLHRAALHGHEAATRVLMMAGANVNLLDGDKRGALALAIRGGHDNVVCSLLLGGASPNGKDKKGDSPLHVAAAHGGHACIVSALLLKGADKNALDFQGRTPLHVAAQKGAHGMVGPLLMAGADPGIRFGEHELSPLDSAVSDGHMGVLRALILHGVDVKAGDSTGYTALHTAADNNQGAAARALVKAGADVEARDVRQRSPLHSAARYNNCCGVVRSLSRCGADVDAIEMAGECPLHMAARTQADRVVDLLLRWGADEMKANHNGNVPADVVGTSVADDEPALSEDQRKERRERVIRLLANAPIDRTWRRRGWLVLCRSRYLLSKMPRDMVDCQQGDEGEDLLRSGSRSNASKESSDGRNRAAKMHRTMVTGGGGGGGGGGGERIPHSGATSLLFGHATGDGDDNGRVAAAAAAANSRANGIGIGGVANSDGNDGDEGSDGADWIEARRNSSGACVALLALAEVEEGLFRKVVSYL